MNHILIYFKNIPLTQREIILSRTKRIYNRRLKKAQRTNLDDMQVHIIHGIPLTRRSQICMGRCPECRDHNKEPRIIRKRAKEEFRLQLVQEFAVGTENDSMLQQTAPWEMET